MMKMFGHSFAKAHIDRFMHVNDKFKLKHTNSSCILWVLIELNNSRTKI